MIVLNTLLLASECFFGGSLLLAMAMLLAHGKPASQRHLILAGGFAVLLALPLASLLLPSHMVWHLAAAAPSSTVPAAMTAAPAAAFDWSLVVLGLAALWVMGVIFVLSKAACGAVALGALYRASVPHIPHGLAATKFRGLNWQLRLRTTPGDAGPITWGILRPIVLLPKSSVTWSRARLEAVLLHEAAHVRRQDCLTRLIALLACALYWPNPLVWVAARAMRRDGETAADDVVLSCGIKASAYAEHLVGLARAFAGSRPSYAGVSLAMAEASMLDARVEAILNPTRSRRALRKSDVLKIAALGLTATAVMALVRPSVAEAKPEAETVAARASQQSAPSEQPVQKAPEARSVHRIVVSTDDAIPPAPPAPPALSPEPAMPALPPAPPAPPAVQAPPAPPSHFTMRWKTDDGIDKTWEGNSAAERAEAEHALAIAKAEHTAAMEKAEIRHATMAITIDLNQAMREHAADFAKAQAEIAKAQAEVHAALAKANISVVVSKAFDKAMAKALKEVRPTIEHARSNAKAEIVIDDDDKDSDKDE